jgi:hypothetical protein
LKRVLPYAAIIFIALMAVIVYLDPLFWKRYLLAAVYSPTHLPMSFYTPTETIEGNEAGEPPRVEPALEQLDPAALHAAAEYAGAHRTTALIVARHGHIVFEQYWDNQRFDAVADLGDFSATLAPTTSRSCAARKPAPSPSRTSCTARAVSSPRTAASALGRPAPMSVSAATRARNA